MIFWDQARQRIKFSATNDFPNISNYSFIGFSSESEFEIILEVLFVRYGDNHISTNEVLSVYHSFRKFLDNLKNITSSI